MRAAGGLTAADVARTAGGAFLRAPVGAAGLLLRGVGALPPRLRRRLGALLCVLIALGAAYSLWFRHSSFVAVEDVFVTGLTTRDAPELRATLERAAKRMTTLDASAEELELAVSGNPVIRSIALERDFPHGLKVRVTEHRAAAVLLAGGIRTPVGRDGVLLRGLPVEGSVPVVPLEGRAPEKRLDDPRAMRLLSVVAAVPSALRDRVGRASVARRRGIVVQLRRGPKVVFGDATRLRAKWTATARVLADSSASGASYIDVRLPERPVAGGLPVETLDPVAPAGKAGAAGAAGPPGAAQPSPAPPAAQPPATAQPPQAVPPSAAQPPSSQAPAGAQVAPQNSQP